jgi:hypothetical protein
VQHRDVVVGEQQVATVGDPDRTLGEIEAASELLDLRARRYNTVEGGIESLNLDCGWRRRAFTSGERCQGE